MESTPGNWTCIALVVLLASAPPLSLAEAPAKDPGDARHCLDLGSNLEIVRCAEPYRHRRGTPRAAPAMPPAATPPEKAAPVSAPAAAPAAAPASASPPAPAPKRKRRSGGVDARHCLDLGSIAAIARCAEKYR